LENPNTPWDIESSGCDTIYRITVDGNGTILFEAKTVSLDFSGSTEEFLKDYANESTFLYEKEDCKCVSCSMRFK
jgi:hypothetical protein